MRSARGNDPGFKLAGTSAGQPDAYTVRGLRLNMANNPKMVKDPTEVALSAIQEALNISDMPAADNARSSVRSDVAPTNASSTSAYNEIGFDARASDDRAIFEPIEEPRPTRRAANDDRETIGQILQAIQKGRPARNVY